MYLRGGGRDRSGCGRPLASAWRGTRREPQPQSLPIVAAARYIGSDACASCHRREADEWRTSQHRDAMADANDESVLGRFDGSTFSYAGNDEHVLEARRRFLSENGRPRRTACRLPGEIHLWSCTHCSSISSSSRTDGCRCRQSHGTPGPRSEGGQRWFHLYPQERITHDDELHWTRPAQNWNFMCADCHSTGVRKNYDPCRRSIRDALVGDQRRLRSVSWPGLASCGVGGNARIRQASIEKMRPRA